MSCALIPGDGLFFVAGPCGMDDRDTVVSTAVTLAQLADELDVALIFKASFDKANRSHGDAWRGPGLDQGLSWLEAAGRASGLPLLTDVHESAQCWAAAEVVDVLQTPAFLCRQTDLLREAGATGLPVNVKRGQFLDPRQAHLACAKVGENAWLTERGTSFGHGDLVFDPRALVWMRDAGVPVLFDATHSVQWPGSPGDVTGGHRALCLPLARAAVAVGVDGIYAEVHPDPASAGSDAATQLTPAAFRDLVREVLTLDRCRRCCDA